MCFRQTDPKVVKFTDAVARFFHSLVPTDLVTALGMFSYKFNRLMKRINGKDTYVERITEIRQSVQADIDKLDADEQGNYVERCEHSGHF